MLKISTTLILTSSPMKAIYDQIRRSSPIKTFFRTLTLELSTPARASLQTLFKNWRKRDKKILNDLYLIMNCHKRNFMIQTISLNLNINTLHIIKAIKLIIMELHQPERVWVRGSQVKITSIGKIQVTKNYLIWIQRQESHLRNNKKW